MTTGRLIQVCSEELEHGGTFTAKVNTGQNHWTIEPDMSVSWLPGPYQFTVHVTLDKNFENSTTHYTNGTTMDWDFTAMHSFGHWSFGPVSYFYKQITADSGPAALNGGSDQEGDVAPDLNQPCAEMAACRASADNRHAPCSVLS